MISINTTEKRFNLTDLYPTSVNESPQRLPKFICGFRKCHSVCSNIWEVSSVTTLLISEMFRMTTNVNLEKISKRLRSVLCTKRENWYIYLKYNCYRALRREFSIARMNLNSRMDCITLTVLERIRLTCCVLPQGKALNVRVYLCMKCIVYLTNS